MKINILISVYFVYILNLQISQIDSSNMRKRNKQRITRNPYPDFVLAAQRPPLMSENLDADGENSSDAQCNESALSGGNPRQKSTNIAQKAAQEAKAATDAQVSAGQAAARQVKMQLADKALQAARAAEAALAGKQQIMEQLQQEVREAEAVVQEESLSLQNSQQNVQAAVKAAEQAQAQLRTLSQAVEIAKSNIGNSEQAANGAQTEYAEKQQLLEAAKSRVEQLLRQLSSARADFSSTKQAAYRAACAAHDAKVNAQRDRRHQLQRRSKEYRFKHQAARGNN
ncbi:plectin-like [Musca domestica]|uniref:Plectin-like n=2 Tax=Musca domestica TaxID=7370 RepID=A0A9J7D6E9_MUSDO|nr:plectin-like [Musca domestica]